MTFDATTATGRTERKPVALTGVDVRLAALIAEASRSYWTLSEELGISRDDFEASIKRLRRAGMVRVMIRPRISEPLCRLTPEGFQFCAKYRANPTLIEDEAELN